MKREANNNSDIRENFHTNHHDLNPPNAKAVFKFQNSGQFLPR